MAESKPTSSKAKEHCLKNCSLKTCSLGQFDEDQSRVDICTALPSKGKLQKIKSQLAVSWNQDGNASFHPECWDQLIKSAKTKGKKKSQIKLLEAEKVMIKEGAETAERHDSKDIVRAKAKRVAELIRSSKHCVCFTGAGISTSAGIGDYRGKSGKWTMDARAGVDVDEMVSKDVQAMSQEDLGPSPSKRRRFSTQESVEEDPADGEGVPYEKLRPTYTHEALVKLMDLNHLKFVISQNGDGLHTLSGVPLNKIGELHGNVFLETCEKCNTRYERPYYVMDDVASQYYEEREDEGKTDIIKPKHAVQCKLCGLSHRTGRKCEKKGCNGYLKDSIINFRDNLEDEIFNAAYDNAEKNDLMLCLGSTLTVTPANELVEMGKRPIRLVICNRQSTDYDNICDKAKTRSGSKPGETLGCHVFGDCDFFMREVMTHILSPEDLKTWEDGRGARMAIYDEKRQ